MPIIATHGNHATSRLASNRLVAAFMTVTFFATTPALVSAAPTLANHFSHAPTITAQHSTKIHSRSANITKANKESFALNQPIIDRAALLSPAEHAELSQQLRQIHDQGLAQIAIVIVPSTDGVPIFDYTLDMARHWQLGDAKRDNGVLMVVVVNDKRLFITTGHGVEGALPDAFLNRLIREDIKPAFKKGNYAQGLNDAINKMYARLNTDNNSAANTKPSNQQPSPSMPLGGLFIMALIFGTFLSTLLGRVMGANLATVGLLAAAIATGQGLLAGLGLAVILWLFLLLRVGSHFTSRAIMGGKGSFGGDFDNRNSSSYRGGGGSFGGGGAGGSW